MSRILWVLFFVCMTPTSSFGGGLTRGTIELGTNDVVAHVPEEPTSGTYYEIRLDVPGEWTSAAILDAVLEFYADVSAVTINDWQNDTPVVELYMLKSPLTGDLDPSQLRRPSAMVRNVRLGENRLVRIHVTEAVKYYLDNPANNHGLVLGSFRGAAEGRFALKPGLLGNGVVATMSVLLRE